MKRTIKSTQRSMGTIRTIEGTRQSSSSVSPSTVSRRYVTKASVVRPHLPTRTPRQIPLRVANRSRTNNGTHLS